MRGNRSKRGTDIPDSFDEWVHYAPLLVITLTIGAVAAVLRDIILALRAKKRAMDLLWQARLQREFVELLMNSKNLDSADFDLLRKSVEARLSKMNDFDRRLVFQGLHQNSQRGSDRYLKELVSGVYHAGKAA